MVRPYLFIFSFPVFLFLSACNSGKPKPDNKKQNTDSTFHVHHVSFDTLTESQFFNYFNTLYGTRHFNGTCLFAHGDSLYMHAFGFASFRNRDSLSVNTSFQLASVSKTITAVAVMQLWEKGKIDLDSDVRAYLPDICDSGITIKMLLCHRSGLPNYMYLTDTFWHDKTVLMNNNDMLSAFKTINPAPYNYPDETFLYCNTNYALLASVIEKITGQTFETYIRQHILQPCHMDHTFLYTEKNRGSNIRIAMGHNGYLEEKEPHYHDGILGDKGIFSSVYDMYQFHKALSSGFLLKPSTLQMMCSPCTDPNYYGKSYGLGFRMMNLNGKKWIYHNGWWHGFRAYFWNNFEEGKCFIALTNTTRDGYLKEEEIIPMLR